MPLELTSAHRELRGPVQWFPSPLIWFTPRCVEKEVTSLCEELGFAGVAIDSAEPVSEAQAKIEAALVGREVADYHIFHADSAEVVNTPSTSSGSVKLVSLR